MASKYPHCDAALKYAKDVVAGKVPACQWVRLACQRQLDDLKRWRTDKTYPYRWDKAKAERVCRFIEKMKHTKGKWARNRETIRLEPWQAFKTTTLFGWIRKANGLRRFTKAFILEPRKNAKSIWAACIGLYMMVADNEFGAEIYSGATTEKQAWEVFRPARLMVMKSPALQQRFGIGVNAKSLHVLATESRFEPLIGKPGDGASPHCSIHDEYHEHDTDAQVDAMETGMGAREQPMSIIISTAGDNLGGPCYAAMGEAQRVLQGVLPQDDLFAIIYTIDEGDDWTAEASLRKANPNFGVSVSADYLLRRQRNAINNPRKAGIFKTKHLNLWVQARHAYFPIDRWLAAADPSLRIEDFAGEPVAIGVDLASFEDIAAVELLFHYDGVGEDARYARFGRYYLPEKVIHSGENEHYRGWVEEGLITETEGDYIDFNLIREELIADLGLYQVLGIGFDPHQARTMMADLKDDHGATVFEFPQTTQNYDRPMKWVRSRISAQKILHNGDPVMAWQLANVVARPDAKDRVFPRKERAENKIDSAVALIIARAVMASEQKPEPPSVFELRARRRAAEVAARREADAVGQPMPAGAEQPAAVGQPVNAEAAQAPKGADDAIDYDVLQNPRHPMFGEMKRRFEKRQARQRDEDW